MIISASRRTDIPNYYFDWFLNRLRAGYVCVRNPVNPRQVSRIPLSTEVVDCIVFWTKNPRAVLGRMKELGNYPYYFQFTLTGYGRDVEQKLPDKREVLIPVFKELARQAGKERIIWRYDPIFLSPRYTMDYHIKAFARIAGSLEGCTEKVVVSFVDFYAGMRKKAEALGIREMSREEIFSLAGKLAETAGEHGMQIQTCAEIIDLSNAGICHGSCIDKAHIEQICGYCLEAEKDKNQRKACGCVESIDIGAYDTCLNGCAYCYAAHSPGILRERRRMYDPCSEILCGRLEPEDKVTDRKVKSLRTDPCLPL